MSAVGWLIAAAGVALLYLSLKPRPFVAAVPSLGGNIGATNDLDPGKPVIVGIPKTILPNGYADCITSGGKWNYANGDCVTAG